MIGNVQTVEHSMALTLPRHESTKLTANAFWKNSELFWAVITRVAYERMSFGLGIMISTAPRTFPVSQLVTWLSVVSQIKSKRITMDPKPTWYVRRVKGITELLLASRYNSCCPPIWIVAVKSPLCWFALIATEPALFWITRWACPRTSNSSTSHIVSPGLSNTSQVLEASWTRFEAWNDDVARPTNTLSSLNAMYDSNLVKVTVNFDIKSSITTSL